MCRYFEINEEFDEKHFKDWLYFVWNVAENSNIATEDAMIGAIRLMKELSAKSGDILTFWQVIHQFLLNLLSVKF